MKSTLEWLRPSSVNTCIIIIIIIIVAHWTRKHANAGKRNYHYVKPALPNRLHDENSVFPVLSTGPTLEVEKVSEPGNLVPRNVLFGWRYYQKVSQKMIEVLKQV